MSPFWLDYFSHIIVFPEFRRVFINDLYPTFTNDCYVAGYPIFIDFSGFFLFTVSSK